MDLFELLFIMLFILFPIMEGIARRRRGSRGDPSPTGEEGEPERSGEEPDWSSAEEAEAEWREREAATAADMVPADLWEALTGQRPERARLDGADSGAADAGAAAPEPVSLGYEGPEAYSLETPVPEPIERTVPTAEARHRAFHDLIDRPKRRTRGRTSPLIKALRSPEGLRQAVLFREILGPPKGLE